MCRNSIIQSRLGHFISRSLNPSFFVPCRCKTKMGERLLGRWLRQPLVDKLKLEARLDMVEYLKDDPMLRGSLQVSP